MGKSAQKILMNLCPLLPLVYSPTEFLLMHTLWQNRYCHSEIGYYIRHYINLYQEIPASFWYVRNLQISADTNLSKLAALICSCANNELFNQPNFLKKSLLGLWVRDPSVTPTFSLLVSVLNLSYPFYLQFLARKGCKSFKK